MSISEVNAGTSNPFDAPHQIDLFNHPGDTRIDIDHAYRMAQVDARELEWLAAAHKRAWGEQDADAQIRIMHRMRAIKGPARPPCTPTRRFSRGRAFPRRAFATHFTTW